VAISLSSEAVRQRVRARSDDQILGTQHQRGRPVTGDHHALPQAGEPPFEGFNHGGFGLRIESFGRLVEQ